MWRWFIIGVVAAAGWATDTLWGQDSPSGKSQRVGISLNSAVITQHKSGTYSVFGVAAVNGYDEDGEALIVTYNAGEPSRQFARRLWVPARSRRTALLPVAIPPNLPADVARQSYVWFALDPQAERETFRRHEGDQLTNSHLILISHDQVRMATIFDRPKDEPDFALIDADNEARETLMTGRRTLNLPEMANDMYGDFLPPWTQVLQGIDVFLLTADRIASDAAGLEALRGWVHDGGRLWIMLDRVSPQTVALVLGNAVDFTVVDQVELDHYEIETLDSTGRITSRDTCDYEVPVAFQRVLTPNRDVPCRIQGWPAAIWVRYGEGEVLLTTLGARGWRQAGERQTTAALSAITARFFAGRDGTVNVRSLQADVQQRIGYQVPGRPFGAVVLGGYCVALVVGGLVLYRRRKSEQLVWLVPLATVLAAGILAGAGAANSRSVPPTVAVTQLVDVAPENDEAHVKGLVAIYDQENQEVRWTGRQRGWVVPDASDNGDVSRQVWTDNDTTETQNASVRAGSIGLAQLYEHRSAARHLSVQARFGPEGLEGQVTQLPNNGTDPVIVAPPAPSLAVKLRPDGSFTSTTEDVLAGDQFLAGALLNDEQRRRQELLRGLFNPADTLIFPHRPTLAFWQTERDSAIELPANYRIDEESLVLVPIELQRTRPGSAFRIPATFLPPSSAAGDRGVSVAFNPKTGVWLTKLTSASDTLLRFQVPDEVRPCELTHGRLLVRINAPSRDLGVWSLRDDERVLVRSVPDPNGVIEFELGPDQLTMDQQGSVRLAVTVSPPRRETDGTSPASGGTPTYNSDTWQIDYVRLTLEGRNREESTQP